MTLRKMSIAKKFPLTLSEEVQRLPREREHRCERDGTPLVPVVFTTGGVHGDPEVFESYPLAMDGWRCEHGEHYVFGAFLSVDEEQRLVAEGRREAERGNLPRAEYAFRRVANSWDDYPIAHVNLGSVYLDRIQQERRGRARAEELERLAAVATAEFEKALACKAMAPPPQARLLLGRIYVRHGKPREGVKLLKEFLEQEPSDTDRKAAERLIAEASH